MNANYQSKASRIDASDSDNRGANNLSEVWDALDSPIFFVEDEDGVNVCNAQVRHLAGDLWIHTDDRDGYVVIDSEAVERLNLSPEQSPLGWLPDGTVTITR